MLPSRNALYLPGMEPTMSSPTRTLRRVVIDVQPAAEGGYTAWVWANPDSRAETSTDKETLVTQGDTLEEAIEAAGEAIVLWSEE